MANFKGAQRSNYVRFKAEALEEVTAYLEAFSIALHPSAEDPGMFCLLPDRTEDGLFSSSTDPEDPEAESEELDLGKVAVHMEPGQILVVQTIGSEKLRYLIGEADAWDWTGAYVRLSLTEIYARAATTFRVPLGDISQVAY